MQSGTNLASHFAQAEKKKSQAEAAERARRKAEQAKQALEAFQRMNNVQADPDAQASKRSDFSHAFDIYIIPLIKPSGAWQLYTLPHTLFPHSQHAYMSSPLW